MAFLLGVRRIHTLTNRFSFHHRLLSTSNELVSEAMKKLDPFTYNPEPTKPGGGDSSPDKEDLDKKLLLTVSLESFRDRHAIVVKHLSDMKDTRNVFFSEINKTFPPFRTLLYEHLYRRSITVQGIDILEKKLDTLIISFKRLKEMTAEDAMVSKAWTKSRLASLETVVKNLSEIRKDFQDDQLWNQMNEGLIRHREMELEQAKVFSLEIKKEIAFASEQIKLLSEIRRKISQVP